MSQSPAPVTPNPLPVPRFSLGQMAITPGAIDALETAGQSAVSLLRRHLVGDWGELSEGDRLENELSVEQGFRILSSYPIGETDQRVWIITEADRSSTTILLPSEY